LHFLRFFAIFEYTRSLLTYRSGTVLPAPKFIFMYYSNKPDHYVERPAVIEEIRNAARGIKSNQPKPTAWQLKHPRKEINGSEPEFIIKRAGKWLRDGAKLPEPKMLFDRFWFEGELCIMFADTNSGKSVLAVQIGDSISKGEPIAPLQMTAAPCGVLYIDYELNDKQFQQRYSTKNNWNYKFSNKFCRAVTNPQANKMYKFSSYQEYLENEIENSLLIAKAKVLIIDNITCLNYDAHHATGALNLVRSLQAIKAKYNISILVLAHTPKRNPVKPITKNDLQGSKMLINFCDSAFAIGESQTQSGTRYLKQIKQRSTKQHYGSENICLGKIEKSGNFLRFKLDGYDLEAAHLQRNSEQYRKGVEERVMELSKQGMSIRRIAAELNLSASMVNRIIKQTK